MAKLAPIGIVMVLAGVACSAKPKDGSQGAPQGIGDVDGPQAPVDAAPDAGTAPSPTAATPSRDVEVRGAIEAADDLQVIAPVATTLALADDAVADAAVPYSVECVTLDAQRKTCSAQVEPTAPRAGTFALSCPGMGAASIACNLRRGEAIDAIVLGNATLLNVGEGLIDLKLTAMANQVPKGTLEPTSTALTTVEELAARYDAAPTDLSASFTGSWSISRLDPGPADAVLSEVYLRDVVDAGNARKVEYWATESAFALCHTDDPAVLDQHLLFDGMRFAVDESSAETLSASLEAITAAVFDAEVERIYRSTHFFDPSPCAGPACALRTEGPLKGLTRYEAARRLEYVKRLFREAANATLGPILEQCPRPPDDPAVCARMPAELPFCVELAQVARLFGRTIELQTLAPRTVAPDLNECLGDAPNGLNPICLALPSALAEIGVKWQPGQRWVFDPNLELPGYLYDASPLCPIEASSETATIPACRAEFLAATAVDQDAAIARLADHQRLDFQANAGCPEIEAVIFDATPTTVAAAQEACRQSYSGASESERRRRLTQSGLVYLSAFTAVACSAPTQAEKLIGAVAASCLRIPFRLSTFDLECDKFFGCSPPKLLPPRDLGDLASDLPRYFGTSDLLQGVDAAFAMNSISHSAYVTYDPRTFEQVDCKQSYESILNATATSANSFDADQQTIKQLRCSNDSEAPTSTYGNLGRYRLTRQ